MAGLHARFYELAPDLDEVLFPGTEHVDALSAGDLTVEIILLCNTSDDG